MYRELQKDRTENLNDDNIQQSLASIKFCMEEKVKDLHLAGGISDKMLLHSVGMFTDCNNNYTRVKKNAKYFTTGNPGYSYPLLKTHKLLEEEIQETPSTNIPVRIVSAISNITTSRCTIMLESLLKPISIAYCGNEYTHDSSHYLESLIEWKQQAISTNSIDHNNIHLIAADVQSLYPSCSRDLVKRALQQALPQSTYSKEVQRLIIDAAMYCMDNVITQFDCAYYSQKVGIITGDNDSVSIANIAMRYIMLTARETLLLCEIARRFIDDIMMLYIGSLQSAEELKACMAEKFAQEGLKLTFRHAHARSDNKEVEFLDVNHVIDASDPIGFITRDFVKPTAVDRVFLNGSSYHPISAFKSIL